MELLQTPREKWYRPLEGERDRRRSRHPFCMNKSISPVRRSSRPIDLRFLNTERRNDKKIAFELRRQNRLTGCVTVSFAIPPETFTANEHSLCGSCY
jgi:hypothetical protein